MIFTWTHLNRLNDESEMDTGSFNCVTSKEDILEKFTEQYTKHHSFEDRDLFEVIGPNDFRRQFVYNERKNKLIDVLDLSLTKFNWYVVEIRYPYRVFFATIAAENEESAINGIIGMLTNEYKDYQSIRVTRSVPRFTSAYIIGGYKLGMH